MAENLANFAQAPLLGYVSPTQTTIQVATPVAPFQPFPAVPFRAQIDFETVYVTAVSGNTWSVTRAQSGTTASQHFPGALVQAVVTAETLATGLPYIPAPASPAEGDVAIYDAGAWTRLPVGANGQILTAGGSPVKPGWAAAPQSGLNQLTSDVVAGPGTGSQSATVVAIQGRAVSSGAPATGNALAWTGSTWAPGVPAGVATAASAAGLSSLPDTTFVDGQPAFVTGANVRAQWRLSQTSALTADGVTVVATQSGTGRFVLLSRILGLVPLTECGVDPTGVADSLAAINAAIAALTGTGVVLFIPAGTYKLSANPTGASAIRYVLGLGVTFTGTGAATMLAAAQGGTPMVATQGDLTTGLVTSLSTSNATIGVPTSTLSFGSSPSQTAGLLRFSNVGVSGVSAFIGVLNSGGSADIAVLSNPTANDIAIGDGTHGNNVIVNIGASGDFIVDQNGSFVGQIGSVSGASVFWLSPGLVPTSGNYAISGSSLGTFVNAPSATTLFFTVGAAGKASITANGIQLVSSTQSLGGGVGVVGIANATTNPTSNPSGGGVLYATAGALHYRGSSGTDTIVGPADLEGFKDTAGEGHCPCCGSDFAHEWSNPAYGSLTVCMKCLTDELGDRPWIIRKGPKR